METTPAIRQPKFIVREDGGTIAIPQRSINVPEFCALSRVGDFNDEEQKVTREASISAIEESNKLPGIDERDSLRDLIRLQLFNQSIVSGEEIDSDWLKNYYRRLIMGESGYYLQEGMPTIGVELEVPIFHESFAADSVLKNLGLEVSYDDANNGKFGDYLFEVSTNFSYGPWIQARTLNELVKFGIVPLESTFSKADGKSSRFQINRGYPLSLHVNMVIPGVSQSFLQNNFQDIAVINKLLYLGYSSPLRITEKKTSTAARIKNNHIRPSARVAGRNLPARVELTTFELGDRETYRMLLRVQRLFDLFGSSARVRCNRRIEGDDQKHRLFEGLLYRAHKTLEKYGISPDYSLDKEFEAQVLTDNPELSAKARQLSGEYSQRWYANYRESKNQN